MVNQYRRMFVDDDFLLDGCVRSYLADKYGELDFRITNLEKKIKEVKCSAKLKKKSSKK